MLDNSMDNLLTILNETTLKCDELNSITEASSMLDVIQKKLSHVQDTLLRGIPGTTNYISDDCVKLIEEVRKIRITDAYRVTTYPNIHNEKKYDVRAGVVINYVLDKIDKDMQNPNVEFDPYKINRQGISYAFKILTGLMFKTEMDATEFVDEYRKYALGSNRKILVYPKVHILTKLAMRTPYILNYIDDKLIFRHIRSLNSYAKDVEDHFTKLINNRPELANQLNRYTDCIEMAIRNILKIYKGIRRVFMELYSEYMSIFREIISLHKQYTSGYQHESVEFMSDSLKNLSEEISSIENLCNNTLNESSETSDEKEPLTNTKESLEKIKTLINCNYNMSKIERENKLKFIESNACLISKVNENASKDTKIFTLLSVNTPIPDDILNILTYAMKIKEINKISDIKELFINIFKDTKYCNCISNDENFISLTLKNLSDKILKNYDYINLNIEVLANNLIKIPNILKEIESCIGYINKCVFDELGKYNEKGEIKNIITYYLIYKMILMCVYNCITTIGYASIDSIKKLIKEV